MGKFQGRWKTHPSCNKRFRVQRNRRAQEINMKLNSPPVEATEQADGFERSEIIGSSASVSKKIDCPNDFFFQRMSPAEAIAHHKNLVITDGVELLSDSSLNPPTGWVYNIHRTWCERKFGTATRSNNFFSIAEEKIKQLSEDGYITALNEDPFYIVIVFPIMQRIQQNISVQDGLFIDTSAFCDQTCSCITAILVATKARAFHIGIIIHEKQAIQNYSSAFQVIS